MYEAEAEALLAELGVSPSDSDIERLLEACTLLGQDGGQLRNDLASLLRQRVVMWAAGGVRREANYRERQAFVAQRLAALRGTNWTPTQALVDRFAKLSSRIGQAGVGPRESITTIDARARA